MRVLIIIGIFIATASFYSDAATLTQELPQIRSANSSPPITRSQKNADSQFSLVNFDFTTVKKAKLNPKLLHFISNTLNPTSQIVADLSKINLSNRRYFATEPLKNWLSHFSENDITFSKLASNIISAIKHIHFSAIAWLFGSLFVGAWGFLNITRKQTS